MTPLIGAPTTTNECPDCGAHLELRDGKWTCDNPMCYYEDEVLL